MSPFPFIRIADLRLAWICIWCDKMNNEQQTAHLYLRNFNQLRNVAQKPHQFIQVCKILKNPINGFHMEKQVQESYLAITQEIRHKMRLRDWIDCYHFAKRLTNYFEHEICWMWMAPWINVYLIMLKSWNFLLKNYFICLLLSSPKKPCFKKRSKGNCYENNSKDFLWMMMD